MKSDMIETFLNKRLLTSPRTRKNYRTSIQGYFKLLEKTLDTVQVKRLVRDGRGPDQNDSSLTAGTTVTRFGKPSRNGILSLSSRPAATTKQPLTKMDEN